MEPAVSGLGTFKRKLPEGSAVAVNERYCGVLQIETMAAIIVGEKIDGVERVSK